MMIKMIMAVAIMAVGTSAIASTPNDNCLTPQQDKELKEAVTGIKITLTATVTALDIAAAAEKDPTTKSNLELAARIISSVEIDLVNNLTSIAESACGTCENITHVVNQTVVAIEQTLSRIEPDWRNNTIWKVVVEAVNDILAIVEVVCPSQRQLRLNDSCLNGTQLKELKAIVNGVQILFTAVDTALDIAAAAEKDATIKRNLEEAEHVISSISEVLLANLTRIAEDPCATCSNIVFTVDDAAHLIEATLTAIEPNWQSDPIFQTVVKAIDQILGYVSQLCPSFRLFKRI
eukprot:TRINITY_DN11318_c0_g1_i1.p1 TRINITY_DN11318_c0_g1~~TRINITY_DN11318_c0_g1_i1.p1  ORF type:complete len:291 (+),score=88.21 TRINITY_DN11318_c0_g1_i1:61-933(+)